MTDTDDAYRDQLVALLPADAHLDQNTWRIHAEWSTDDAHWELRATWNPGRPATIAIHGPEAATVLHRPTIATVEAYHHQLGAIPTNPLADALVAFCEGYVDAWADGDAGQQSLLLHQLHTALNQQAGQP